MKKILSIIVALILSVIILSLVFVYIHKSGRLNYGSSNRDFFVGNLPSCQGSEQFITTPVDFYADSSIIPLGNLNPIAGHVTPTDHIYFNLHSFQGKRSDSPGPQFTLRSPGNITLTGIQKSEHTLFGNVTRDYRLSFSLCRELGFFFDHVQTLSPAVQAILDKSSTPSNCGNDQQGNTGQNMCQYVVSSPIKVGEELGSVGIGFDFGGYDLRTQSLAFINKERTLTGPYQYFHTICPLDYFSPDTLKISLYRKVKNTVKNVQGLPDCGTTMQDKPGTIQGNWYMTGSAFQNGLQRFDQELAIVHSNTDPHLGVISVGGTITQPGETQFVPTDSGTVNREPSQVGVDSKRYCYQGQYFSQGHFVLQLTDSTTLKIEYQSGPCITTPNFIHPSVYVR